LFGLVDASDFLIKKKVIKFCKFVGGEMYLFSTLGGGSLCQECSKYVILDFSSLRCFYCF